MTLDPQSERCGKVCANSGIACLLTDCMVDTSKRRRFGDVLERYRAYMLGETGGKGTLLPATRQGWASPAVAGTTTHPYLEGGRTWQGTDTPMIMMDMMERRRVDHDY